ncbi:MAG: hypothetical protein AAF958_05480 [Planctomycetota bacterium]
MKTCCPVLIALAVVALFTECAGSDGPAAYQNAIARPKTAGAENLETADAGKWIDQVKNKDKAAARAAADRLLRWVKKNDDGAGLNEALAWSFLVFRHAPDVEQRRTGFAFLKQHRFYRLAECTRTITIMTPNYPCVGSFERSLRNLLVEDSTDVWSLDVEYRPVPEADRPNAHNAMTGTPNASNELIISIVVSGDVTTRDVLQRIKDNGHYDQKHWSVMQRMRISDALAASGDG